MRTTARGNVIVLLLGLGTGLCATPGRADEVVCGPTGLAEDFHEVVYKNPSDPQRPGMWFINFGNGQQYYDDQGSYAERGESSSITGQIEGTTDYLRMSLEPDPTPGDYVDVEASELRTGHSYGSPCADTYPTPGHPVQVTARMRCTTCKADGSGGQVGTWGLWLWNSYPDVPAETIHPITSIGFNWIQEGGYFPPGLAVSVLNETNPLYYQPVRLPVGIDLGEWHVYRFVWRADSEVELVTFFIDDAMVGVAPIARPVTPMGELSLTIWHDNQVPIDPTAFPATEIMNPTAPQHLDVDYVRVDR